MLCSETLRDYVVCLQGARYHARIDAFSLALFILGCVFVFLLDLFFLLSPESFQHRASTDSIVAVLGCYVCAAVGALVLAAARCNHPERLR